MTDTSRYPAYSFWSVEDDRFIALALDLPGCSAFGTTQAEALSELQSAIRTGRLALRKSADEPTNQQE